MRTSTLIVTALITFALALPLHAREIKVVTSFSILADIVLQVGGEHVTVSSIIGPDEDAHGFQARPSHAREVQSADLVVANGLGFDNWLERLSASVGQNRLLIASTGVEAMEESAHHHHHHGHDHGPHDPHAWQDVANVRIYTRNIAAALVEIAPQHTEAFTANASRYDAELAELDDAIRSALAAVPADRRKIVTSHDAFGYFGRAYGITVLAAAGISYESEPSAASIARLIRQLRREQAPVVFVENISDPRMIERIARESGATMGGRLYSDALSAENMNASTYVGMMRLNLQTLLEGLMPSSN